MKRALCVWLFLGIAASGRAAPESAGALRRTRMHILGSASMFTVVNQNDALASMKVWTLRLGQRYRFDFDLKIDIFRSPEEALVRLQSQTVDLLMLDTPDYLALAASHAIEPLLIGQSDPGQPAAYRYLLLSREGSGIGNVADLKNTRMMVSSRTGAGMGIAWLDQLLGEARIEGREQHFESLTSTPKASACVLPLFFGRTDACIVDGSSWATLKEMNPQLARLKVLARSEPILEGVLAMPVKPHPFRAELIDALLEIHKDPAGAQLSMLFKIGPLMRVRTGDFDIARQVWSKYKGPLRTPAAAAPAREAPSGRGAQ